MKFSKYLLLCENKAQPISEEEAERIANEKCNIILQSNIHIYRGINSKEPYMFGDAKFDIPRKSAYTSNFSTLIIDNSPNWNEYPKRSKSYICSGSNVYAGGYGTLYKVYPFDGANIGICPDVDIWYSFVQTLAKLNITCIDNLNHIIELIFESMTNRVNVDKSFASLKSACEEIDTILSARNYDFYKVASDFDHMRPNCFNLLRYLTKQHKTPLLHGFMTLLDPTVNNFTHIKLNEITSKPLFHNNEVWTDSPCIFEKVT